MLKKPLRNISGDAVVIAVLLVATLASALFLPVNPWPRDGWFVSHERLFGSFPGQDNYTPIAVPALFFKLNHWVSQLLGFDLRWEMYLASLAQNLLIFVSGLLVYRSCRFVSGRAVAGLVSVLYLVHVLSTGLAQAFWSEGVLLAMFAAVLYLNLAMREAPDQAPRRFWALAVLSSLLIGGLVATRVTPALLIPTLLLLLYSRLRPMRLLGYSVAMCLATVILVLALMASNQARFGRFEMTNSTGRHLWQGVNEIVDVALAGSPEFMRLKEVNPDIRGKNHWEIRLPGQAHAGNETAEEELAIVLAREEVLKRLSMEAIRNAPLLFLQQGLIDFSKTIGLASYRVGFGQPGGHYNPLETREPLPPLARALPFVPPVLVKAAGAAIRLTYEIGYRLYPIVVLFVLASYVALLLNWIRLRGSRAAGPGPEWPNGLSGVLVFVIAGTLFTGLVVTSLAESRLIALERVAIIVVCAGVLLWQAKTLLSVFRVPADCSARDAADSAGLYTFLAAIYFGSLWFSWQVEANNTRNVLPYLPFLALMLAIALEGWRQALPVSARGATRYGAPAPDAGS